MASQNATDNAFPVLMMLNEYFHSLRLAALAMAETTMVQTSDLPCKTGHDVAAETLWIWRLTRNICRGPS